MANLEDSVAPLAKAAARRNVVDVLKSGEWLAKTLAVRVNDWTTEWTYQDVVEVGRRGGACPALPDVAEGPDARSGGRAGLADDPTGEGQRIGR
jgi:citrate lyase subunit beta/citryl-CoA lyase